MKKNILFYSLLLEYNMLKMTSSGSRQKLYKRNIALTVRKAPKACGRITTSARTIKSRKLLNIHRNLCINKCGRDRGLSR